MAIANLPEFVSAWFLSIIGVEAFTAISQNHQGDKSFHPQNWR
jgi:hypothetical protein